MDSKELETIYTDIFNDILDKSFDYKTVKPKISDWVENNLVLPKEASRISGKYSYDNSPYVREIIDRMHPSDSSRQLSIMKGTQCGITTGFIVPFMMWCIVNHPSNILFTSKDKDIARRTIRTKFDLFMQKSGFDKLIRSNNQKHGSKRTGDTDYLKEYAGGQMAIESTQNIQNFREFAAKYCLIDEFDTAISADKKEGSLRATIEGRQNSYGGLAKIAYVSTPTTTQTSNIYKAYLEGDQRKWNWICPNCKSNSAVEFQIKGEDGSYSGLVWELDSNKKLISDSIRYRFPCCGHKIEFKEKNNINKKGFFVPTAEPIEPGIYSYNLNSLILGPGFISWEKIVRDFLKACPPGEMVDINKLMAFNFTHLGLPFEERGKSPNIMRIMENTSSYDIGVVPNLTCEADGNGKIALISMAVDLGGIMNNEIEDVRLDWEILAHTSNGSTYSINHGSIGTFKRTRAKTKAERDDDLSRERLTYMHGQKNSAWDRLEDIIKKDLVDESGDLYNVSITLIDTGHFTKHAYEFVNKFIGTGINVYGIKGSAETDIRKVSKDTQPVKKSTERPSLYLLQVSQLKDELSQNMQLRKSDDGTQLPGFMNFPEPANGKYSVKGFFRHYESEERKEEKVNGEVVGYSWKKKQSSIENHFFDVRVYNIAAKYIWIDLIKRSNPTKYKHLDWALFVENLI